MNQDLLKIFDLPRIYFALYRWYIVCRLALYLPLLDKTWLPKKYLYPLSRLEARPGTNQDNHENIIDRNRVIIRDGFRCRICNMIPRFPKFRPYYRSNMVRKRGFPWKFPSCGTWLWSQCSQLSVIVGNCLNCYEGLLVVGGQEGLLPIKRTPQRHCSIQLSINPEAEPRF